MVTLLSNMVVLLAAAGGFFLAIYLYTKKQRQATITCPMNGHCDAVVHSSYSKFFGIPVELMGMLYYALIGLWYVVLLTAPGLSDSWVAPIVLAVSLLALLFSTYLTFLQLFVIHDICTWCITSAALCFVIFLAALFGTGFDYITFLGEWKRVILTLHIIGIALGVGAATCSDVFFFKYLKDYSISKAEAETLKIFSEIVWFAIGILVVTGIALYLPHWEILNQTPKFLVKVLVVAVVIANGAVLNAFVSPHLESLGFKKTEQAKELKHYLRRFAFLLGSVSVVSWYAAIIFAMLPRGFSWSFTELLIGYVGVLIVAMIISQLVERELDRWADRLLQ